MTPSGSGNSFEDNLVLSGAGDRAAYDRVFAETYRELQQLAHHARRRLHGATLDTTALVHECYLRLLKRPPDAASAAHFLGIAARAMRHLLIERARARLATKRGADLQATDADADEVAEMRDARELIEIDDLLRTLEQRRPQQATIVECRFFGGLSEEDTASALGVSVRTVQREWMQARQWLAAQHG